MEKTITVHEVSDVELADCTLEALKRNVRLLLREKKAAKDGPDYAGVIKSDCQLLWRLLSEEEWNKTVVPLIMQSGLQVRLEKDKRRT